MTYTYISAQYANESNTAAIALTEEVGHIAITKLETPEDWADLHAAITVEEYQPPVILEPTKEDLLVKLQEIQQQILNLKDIH